MNFFLLKRPVQKTNLKWQKVHGQNWLNAIVNNWGT